MPPRPGAFADYVAAPLRNLEPFPDNFPAEKAALAEPVAVSYHAVNQGAAARPAALGRADGRVRRRRSC
nr:hypothetical protein [Hansschlegelia zhihuaiae]